MHCPKCGGKIRVRDVVHNNSNNETYRLKRCDVCENEFYTVEFELVQQNGFENIWRRNYRSYQKEKKDE